MNLDDECEGCDNAAQGGPQRDTSCERGEVEGDREDREEDVEGQKDATLCCDVDAIHPAAVVGAVFAEIGDERAVGSSLLRRCT